MPQHKMSTEEFKEKVYNRFGNDVEILSEYNGGTNPIDILYHCKKHGDIYKTIHSKNIFGKQFQPCKKCNHEIKSEKSKNAKFNDKEYHYNKLKEKIELQGGKLITKQWTKAKDNYEIICDKGHTFITTADCINSKNQWCPYCSGRKGNFEEEIKEIIKNKNGELLSSYVSSRTHVKVKCNIHNYTWSIMPLNIKKGRWCPICNLPYAEKIVYNYLHNNNYKFDVQYTFDNLKSENNELLRFDFVIFDNNDNIKYLLEIDDEEHRYHHIQPRRVKAKERDELKNKYCEKNNIHLFRMEYKHNNTYLNESWYYNFIKKNIIKYDNVINKLNKGGNLNVKTSY